MLNAIVADDNNRDRRVITEIIDWNALGVKLVGAACNGQEALDMVKERSPELVITDISMPALNGKELAKSLSEEFPSVRVVFMSCYSDFKYAKAAISLNVSSYIVKPIVPEELIEAVKRACNAYHKEMVLNKERNDLKVQLEEYRQTVKASHVKPGLDEADNDRHITNRERKIVDEIKNIIHTRYAEQITVNDISESIYLCAKQASHIFKKVTGITIFDYLVEYRINLAKKLLMDPSSRIYLVADQVGYTNKSHFALMFKKVTGVTPNDFRSHHDVSS